MEHATAAVPAVVPSIYHETLNRVVAAIKQKFDPEKIILFGSLARGEIEEWGDIDLLVIVPTALPFRDRARAAADIARDFDEDLDLFIYTPQEFEEMNQQWHPFMESIKRNHLVIFEKGK